MAKKKKQNGQRDAYRKLIKNRKFDNPFDFQDTNDAAGKSIDELMKEFKRRQFFENPQSPRA